MLRNRNRWLLIKYFLTFCISVETVELQNASDPLMNYEGFQNTTFSLTLSTPVLKPKEAEAEEALANLVYTLVKEELQECGLVILTDGNYYNSPVVQTLLRMPNVKQIAKVSSEEDLKTVMWKSSLCRGYFIILKDPEPLLSFASHFAYLWDYGAKFFVVGLTKKSLEDFTRTKKGKLTEFIIGIVQSNSTGEYLLYMNQLYITNELRHVSTWRQTAFIRRRDFFPEKIRNLQGAVLKVITFDFSPSTIYHRDSDGKLLLIYGYNVAVVEALADFFNFTIDYIEPPPGERWGEITANGSWNGMIGMLARDEGDLCIAELYITSLMGRREFQDFTAPFATEVDCFMIRVEPPLPRWKSLGLPFTIDTWLAIFLGFLLLGPVLFVFGKLTPARDEMASLKSLGYSCIYTTGMHFRVAQEQLPRGLGLQLFVVTLWLYVIIITTGYSSNLTAFLTVERRPSSVDTFEALYHSNMKVLGLGPFFGNAMATSTNWYLRALSERFISVDSYSKISPEVLKGSGVMIQGRRYLTYKGALLTTKQNQPRVRIMKECFLTFSVSVGIQTHSPLKRHFDSTILRIFESGLVSYWFQETITLSKKLQKSDDSSDGIDDSTTGEVPLSSSSSGVPLSISHLQGIFLVFVIGLFLSTLIFLTEVAFGKAK